MIVGVGRKSSGDDAAGPELVRLLLDAGVTRAIDAGESPETETWRIREMAPDGVLFVDAVDMGAAAGDAALLESGDLRTDGCDTHRAPISLTMQYLEAELGCACRLLAIQPRTVRHGAPMSEEVRATVEQAALLLAEFMAR